jgi:hypothetical protein
MRLDSRSVGGALPLPNDSDVIGVEIGLWRLTGIFMLALLTASDARCEGGIIKLFIRKPPKQVFVLIEAGAGHLGIGGDRLVDEVQEPFVQLS